LWEALMVAINATDPASEEADRVVDAANATFRLFHDGLTRQMTANRQPSSLSHLQIGP
jgi:heme oxygenase